MRKLLILLSLVLIGMGCNQTSQEAEEPDDKTVRVTTVKSTKIKYQPHRSYSGTSFPFREANLGTTLPGKVEKIHYEKGQHVSKGTLLVELSAELYAQALAKKNTLEKDFSRISRLREKGSVTQQKYDHVKAEYEAAKAEARMMRDNCRIIAPFSGVIVDYLVQAGENFMFSPALKPGYSHTSGIVQLMQLDKLKIKIDINEQELYDINEGQTARVTFDALPDTTFEGRISHISPALSMDSHSAKVEVTIGNSEGKLRPGMYATVRIGMQEREDVFVPLNAIFRQNGTGNNYVFEVSDKDVAVRKPVTILYTRDTLVAVSGIDEGHQVVVHGKNKLKNREKVIVNNQQPVRIN